MKLLVIGGMHGNEPLGIELVRVLQAQPIKNVDAVIANNEALAANVRFTGLDLNRSFPGKRANTQYESRRAAEMVKLCKQYDIVLDFHNTYCPDNDCSFVGETAEPKLYDLSGYLKLKRVIVADYDCINKYVDNCLSVEVSMNSNLNTVAYWLEKIAKLGELSVLPKSDYIEKYRFVYRITLEDSSKFNLSAGRLWAFKPISDELAQNMGVDNPAYPIFISDRFTPYNYGGLLNRLR